MSLEPKVPPPVLRLPVQGVWITGMGADLQSIPRRVVTVCPSKLSAIPGLHAWRRELENSARIAGTIFHLADCGVDTGPILVQGVGPVLAGNAGASSGSLEWVQLERLDAS